ncbi:MAG: nucleoside-diphosphate kinase [Clostridia bacterium]|nr:nucleoside-diphosphate kinase [Clostridia bacterium]
MERTFVMVKPDGVQRGLTGQVIARVSDKGYQLIGLKMLQITPQLAGRHYAEHEKRPFFQRLVEFITSGPVVAMVWQGPQAVSGIRSVIGKTDPQEALPGSIRGDWGVDIGHNVVHGSDSPESAEREIALFFQPEELVEYERTIEKWVW